MKKYKLLSLILALTVIMSAFAISPVSAAKATIDTPSLDDDTAVVTVSGSLSGAKRGDALSVFIAKEGADVSSASAWTKEEFLLNVAAFVQTTVSSDGKYTANMSMLDSDIGDYVIYVSAKGETSTLDFFFADKQSKQKFIGEIADIVEKDKSASEIEKKLSLTGADSAVAKTFGIAKESRILAVDASNLSEIFLSLLKEEEAKKAGTVRAYEPSEFVKMLDLAAVLETVNDGSVNITVYEELFGLDKDFINTYKDYVENKTGFTSCTSGKGIKSVEDAKKLFKEAVCTEIAVNPSGYAAYLRLIDAHGEWLGLDMTTYGKIRKKENITNYLTGSYSNLSAFKTAANTAIKKAYDKENSGGSSGGSSGGGGGGYSSKVTASAGGNLSTPVVPLDNVVGEPAFTDVDDSHWGRESIVNLAKRGILSGTGNGAFEPDRQVTREEFVKIIVLAMGLSPSDTKTEFTDLEENGWYQGYIVAAKEAGIINGISETEFGLGQPVSRQDAAAMIYRAALKKGYNLTAKSDAFADDESIADYAREGVYALKNAGIINGMGDGLFIPADSCSRAQTAKMVYEYLKKGEEK